MIDQLFPLFMEGETAAVEPGPILPVPLAPVCRRRAGSGRRRSSIVPVANSDMFFTKQTETFSIDPLTGNRVIDMSVENTVTIRAVVIENSKRLPNAQVSYGAESNRTPIKGWILSDPEMFSTLDLSERIPTKIYDPAIPSEVEGYMVMSVTVTPYSEQLKTEIGVPFTGMFLRVGSGETPEFPDYTEKTADPDPVVEPEPTPEPDPIPSPTKSFEDADVVTVTASDRIPGIGRSGSVHIQRRSFTSALVWVSNDKVFWTAVDVAETVQIIFTPTSTQDLTVSFDLNDFSIPPRWENGEGEVTSGNSFTQPANVTTPVKCFIPNVENPSAIVCKGVSAFPAEITTLTNLTSADFSACGLVGECVYLGNLNKLATIDISNNPLLTLDLACILDNPLLTVVKS